MFNIDVYYWRTVVVRITFASAKRSVRACAISINSTIAALLISIWKCGAPRILFIDVQLGAGVSVNCRRTGKYLNCPIVSFF